MALFGTSFNTIAQALETFKLAAGVVNNNIANASNSNYAVENPIFQTLYPQGVSIEDIQRVQDFYYTQLLNNQTSLVDYLGERKTYNNRVQNIYEAVGPNSSSSFLQDTFFQDFNQVLANPTNVGDQNQVYTDALSLAQYISSNRQSLDSFKQQVTSNASNYINEINSIVKNLAQLNQQITSSYALTYSDAHDYKSILDQRDAYINQLSQLINIHVTEDNIGRVHVSLDGGFTLVDGTSYWTLSAKSDPTGQYVSIYWNNINNQSVDITNIVSSGKLKGLVDFGYDASAYRVQSDNWAANLITNVKLPVNSGSNFYLIQNLTSTTALLGTQSAYWKFPPTDISSTANLLSSYQINGSLTFYVGNSPSFTISNYGSLNLYQIANDINTQTNGSFSAVISQDPQGNYYLSILNTSSTVANLLDSSSNIIFSNPGQNNIQGILNFVDQSSSATLAQINYSDMSLDSIVNAINSNANLTGKYYANIVSSPFVDMPLGLPSQNSVISQTGVLSFRNNTNTIFSITYTGQTLIQLANEIASIPSNTVFTPMVVKEEDGLWHLRIEISNPNNYNVIDSGSSFTSLYSLQIKSLNQSRYTVIDQPNTFFLQKNVISQTVSLSNLGLNGTLTFYSSNVPIFSIANYGQYSLSELSSLINSNPSLTGIYSSSIVSNMDGTFTLQINSNYPNNYTIADSSNNFSYMGGNIYRAERVFTGTDSSNISINQNLSQILNNLNTSSISSFVNYSSSWWQSAKASYQALIDSMASTNNNLTNSYSSQSTILNGIQKQVSQIQGVSIDQQMMNLQNLQYDYEASAKAINAIDSMIQSVLSMIPGG